jgi:hypothetical protein
MTKTLAMIIPALIGSVIVVNGVMIKGEDAVAAAKVAANQMNIHQLDNALELYYSDHDSYPAVEGGEALTRLLLEDGYIRNQPAEPDAINYKPKNNNQDYSLTLAN